MDGSIEPESTVRILKLPVIGKTEIIKSKAIRIKKTKNIL